MEGEPFERVRVGKSGWALVDPDVAEWARQHAWYKKEGYAVRHIPHDDGTKTEKRMHREITGAPPNRKIWHKNGNLMDNRRENLIVTTNLSRFNKRRRHRGSDAMAESA